MVRREITTPGATWLDDIWDETVEIIDGQCRRVLTSRRMAADHPLRRKRFDELPDLPFSLK